MLTFNQLKKNTLKKREGMKSLKLAILGDSPTQMLVQAVKGMGIEYSLDITVFEADFNQIALQVFDSTSELYSFQPDIVMIFESTHKLLQKFNRHDLSAKSNFAEGKIQEIDQFISTINSNIETKIIYLNFSEEDDRIFGQYGNKIEYSFIFQLRKLNYLVQNHALNIGNLFICDISTIQNTMGRERFWSPTIYTSTEMVLSLDAIPTIAQSIVQIICSILGDFKKCAIVDLDNTIWGGIIGDDGIENIQIGQLGIGKAFTEFQYWLKKLKERGIILAVCSKNNESVAKEPFEKHPEMILKLEDISVFIANWDNKADNIRKIQKILNIGFDSMVFLDDNPFERNIVRENIPGICIPELPEDPAMYLDYLYELNLFETVSFSNEDTQRTALYQTETKRIKEQASFTDENEFLKSLNMKSITKPFDAFSLPRVAQLSQRSNQFNLRTVRYTEDDVAKLMLANDYHTLSFTLEDKFGDNGLVCVIVLKKMNEHTLFIENWFMSCRVLKRGMERYVLNCIVDVAKQHGFKTINGEYIATSKNEMVKDHYELLGFDQVADNTISWSLTVEKYLYKENYITKI